MKLTNEQLAVINCDDSFQVTACAGGGKGFVKGTRVLTPSGYVTIESISEGDMIIGKSGKSVKVVGVYPRGLQTCYRVSFSNGYSVICDEDHLWAYQLPRDRWNGGSFRVHDIKYIYENVPVYVKNGSYSRKNIYLPMVDPVDFGVGVSDFMIHPYVLGCLLGDGSLSGRHAVGFTNQESDIIDRFCGLLPESCSMSDSGNFDYRIRGSDGVNLVYRELERLGLSGKHSYEKFIPEEYLFSSVDSRVSLLQGLIDTDGYVAGSSYEFTTTSERLANDIVFLCDTLGLSVTFSVRDGVGYEYKGDLRHGRVYYRLRIKPSSSIPVLHSSLKHSSRWRVPQSYARVCITGIELLDEKFETICLKVDSDDELFVIDRCIVTHNTSTLLEWVRQHPNLRTLYLAFNRSVKLEMESKAEGIKNLTVMTAHGLAYQNVMRGSKYEIRSSFSVMDVLDLLDLSELDRISESVGEGCSINEMEFAMMVLSVFNSLCYSRYLSINDEEFRSGVRSEFAGKLGESIFDAYLDFMYRCVISIWRSMKSASIPVTHDFYLKLYQVSQPKLDFDVILLDECIPGNYFIDTDTGRRRIDSVYNSLVRGEIVHVKSFNSSLGSFEFKRALNPLKSEDRTVLEIETEGMTKIRCTPNHKLLTLRGYVDAGCLERGVDVILHDNPSASKTEAFVVKSIKLVEGVYDVYDFEVEDLHNFVVYSEYNSKSGMIVHNCQDSNDVMLDIIERQNCIKGFVGDACQQIYGFRKAVNAFSKLDHRSFVLSNSFRFGSEVSKLANEILSWRDVLGANDTIRVNGVMEYEDDSIDSVCYIARKNITLLAKAFDLINADFELTLYFEGGFNGYTFSSNGSIWDVYNLWSGQVKKIKSRFIARFKTWDTFLEFVDKGLDHELLVLTNIVEKYRNRLPDLLHRLKSRVVDSREDAGVILSTVHKAKGLEYDFVYILGDFIRWNDVASIAFEVFGRSLNRESGDIVDVDFVMSEVSRMSGVLAVSDVDSDVIEGDIVDSDLDDIEIESVPLNANVKAIFAPVRFDREIEEINMLYVAVTRARKKVSIDRSYYFDLD